MFKCNDFTCICTQSLIVASFPGLLILQAIKNRNVGRPGKEASLIAFFLFHEFL